MRSHIDETVIIGNNAITTIVSKDYFACACSADELTIGIVCEATVGCIGNIAGSIMAERFGKNYRVI